MKPETAIKNDIPIVISTKALAQRKEFEKIIDQLKKQNDTISKMNKKNILLISQQNERIAFINKKIEMFRKSLIIAWGKSLKV